MNHTVKHWTMKHRFAGKKLLVSLGGQLLVASLGLGLGCDKESDGAPPKSAPKPKERPAEPIEDDSGVSPAALLDRVRPLFSPLPPAAETPDNPLTDAKVELGRMLYFDTRLSKNRDLSCNTCHDLAHYGIDVRKETDRLPRTSRGHKNQAGERNSPTVYNAAIHMAQFWDGRSPTVEEQAKGPLVNPVEMAMKSEVMVATTIRSVPGYEEPFKAAFPDDGQPITIDNISKAIGAFERKLMTPSRFDEFLGGKLTALDDQELKGLELFVDVGCTQCHTGAGIGGNQFQKLGSVKPWDHSPDSKDTGRHMVTSAEIDKYVFKVPSLRNVTETGPYLHDGSISSLAEIVDEMAEHQTNRGNLKPPEIELIVAFLESLKGELPAELIQQPQLPPDGPKTPKADPS